MNIALRKRAQGGLGALGRWAAGNPITVKSDEELEDEANHKMLAAHREAIIWFLQTKLQEAGNVQASMMETRIQREVEKSKSVLYKAKAASVPYDTGDFVPDASTNKDAGREAEPQLTQEQMQLFAQENQDMLKHYEDTLSQVR